MKDYLSKDEIQKDLNSFYHTIEIKDKVTSTNDVLKDKANGLNEGYVLIADTQSKGKGRNGRSFHSPENTGIYMSILIKPDISIYDSLKLTTLTAVAVLNGIMDDGIEEDGIEDCGIVGFEGSIKWINDIYIQDKKIAGILCESSIDMKSDNIDYMVIGIGINVHSYEKPDELKDVAGSIEDFTDTTIDRNNLITKILNNFYHYYSDLNNTEYLNIYRKHSYVLGKKIKVIQGLETFNAIAIDIDDKGGLIIEKEDHTRLTLTSGEISIKVDENRN